MEVIKWPFGKADKNSVAQAASMSYAITNAKTILDLGTLTQDSTLAITQAADLPVGADITITAASDGTARQLTLGTGFSGNAVAGTISKTKIIKAEYNGVAFVVYSVLTVN